MRQRVIEERVEEECAENSGADEGGQRWTKGPAFIEWKRPAHVTPEFIFPTRQGGSDKET